MKHIAKYLTDQKPNVQKVYFNAKGEWSLVVNKRFPIEKTRDEVIAAGEAEEDAEDVTQVETAEQILAKLQTAVTAKAAAKAAKKAATNAPS